MSFGPLRICARYTEPVSPRPHSVMRTESVSGQRPASKSAEAASARTRGPDAVGGGGSARWTRAAAGAAPVLELVGGRTHYAEYFCFILFLRRKHTHHLCTRTHVAVSKAPGAPARDAAPGSGHLHKPSQARSHREPLPTGFAGASARLAVPLTSQDAPAARARVREVKVTAGPRAPPPGGRAGLWWRPRPRPAPPARASRSPRPAPPPPAPPAAPARRGAGRPCGGSPERPCGGMRGRGGGRARWPAPVRSLLRAFGARDAAAAARGPERGKRRGASPPCPWPLRGGQGTRCCAPSTTGSGSPAAWRAPLAPGKGSACRGPERWPWGLPPPRPVA